MRKTFLFLLVVLVAFSAMGQRRRAVRSPSPAIEPVPFAIAISNLIREEGNNAITSQFGYVPFGTYTEKKIWAKGSSVPVVYTQSTIINPGAPEDFSLWYGQVYYGPIPADWEYAELLVTEPGKPTKRAFLEFVAGGGAGPARAATIDASGGIHLDGFFLHRPVVVVSWGGPNVALKSDSPDFNYFLPRQGVDVGTILTVCEVVQVVGVGVVDLNNRVCRTGSIEADQ